MISRGGKQKEFRTEKTIAPSRANNNQETFIPNCFGTPTDLKPPCSGFQLAQINKLQQAFKELTQTKTITVRCICTIITNFSQN